MRLRDWPPRRIGKMWLIGFAVQLLALLVVPRLMGFELAWPGEPWPPMDTLAATPPAGPAAQSAAIPDSVALTPVPRPAGDTLLRAGSDSMFLLLRQRGGDTVQFVDASPGMKEGAGQLGTILAGLMADLVRALVVMMVLLFAIPLVFLAVTLTWAVQRRRRPAG